MGDRGKGGKTLKMHVVRGNYFYVPASYILYLSDFCRFLLCTCEWERRGERGAGEGEGAREKGIECILYGYS
jgi:hypothetical protein